MDNDFANFDEIVRSQHEEMDRQVWIYSSEYRKMTSDLECMLPDDELNSATAVLGGT